MGPTCIERSVNINADYDPGYRKWKIARAAEIGLKGCFASPALSLATSYDFWHGVTDVFDDFLRATTVAYYCHWHRHDGARSQVIDTNPSTSGFNMPIYWCGLKPDEFRHANENRISDLGLTCINLCPGYWVRSSSVNMTLAGKTHRDRFVPDLIQYGTLCLFMWSKVVYQCQRPSEVKLWDGLKV